MIPSPTPKAETSRQTPLSEWKWLGYPGHFINAKACQFRLCTQVGRWLVSTVGDMRDERKDGMQRLGGSANSFFETYIFDCGEAPAICDVVGCGCGMPTPPSMSEIDGERAATPGEATATHMRYCHKYAALAGGAA